MILARAAEERPDRWAGWPLFVVGLAVFTVLAVVRVVVLVRAGETAGSVVLVVSGAAGVLVGAVLVWMVLRVGLLRRRVAAARPGAVVVPGCVVAVMVAVARDRGVPRRPWALQGGQPVALAVTSADLEVWAGNASSPRWTIPLAAVGAVANLSGRYGPRKVQAVGVWDQDGALVAALVPAYRSTKVLVGGSWDQRERARHDLRTAIWKGGSGAFPRSGGSPRRETRAA